MEKHTDRDGPPADNREWAKIRATLDRADMLWIFIGPLAQVSQNWRWWAGAIATFLILYRAEVAQAVAILTGAGQ